MTLPGQKNTIRQQSYRRAELLASDHKPVSALFDAEVVRFNFVREREAFTDVMKIVDKWENDRTPKVELDGKFIDFPSVPYESLVTAKIVIKNIGYLPATWEFRSIEHFMPRWNDDPDTTASLLRPQVYNRLSCLCNAR